LPDSPQVASVGCRGRRLAQTSLVVAVMLVASTGDAPAAQKRIAVVIGNSQYQLITRLANPANDARLIAKTLSDAGFTLVDGKPADNGALVDLTKTQLEQAIGDFGSAASDADVALFYYAGHGLEQDGRNYIVPIDKIATRSADVDLQMINADTVLHQMSASSAKLKILVLDACRTNPFPFSRGLIGGLTDMGAPSGTFMAYAAWPGHVAQDGNGNDSPYTSALAQQIKVEGHDLFTVFNEVALQVELSTHDSQQPYNASSGISGVFYFTPPKQLVIAKGAGPEEYALAERELKTGASPKIKSEPPPAANPLIATGYGAAKFGMSPTEVNQLFDQPFENVDWSVLPHASEYKHDDIRYLWTYLRDEPRLLRQIERACVSPNSYVVFMFKNMSLFRVSIRLWEADGCPDYKPEIGLLFGREDLQSPFELQDQQLGARYTYRHIPNWTLVETIKDGVTSSTDGGVWAQTLPPTGNE
jgi:hypothetical protein